MIPTDTLTGEMTFLQLAGNKLMAMHTVIYCDERCVTPQRLPRWIKR